MVTENDLVLTLIRDATEKGILSSESSKKIEAFNNKLENLASISQGETYEIVLQLREDFYSILGDLRKEFFTLGEIKNEISSRNK